MKTDLSYTPLTLWRALPYVALAAACMGTALADQDSMPTERQDLGVVAEKSVEPLAPAPPVILGPGLSTIGLDFEMSRLDDDTGFIPPDTMGDVGPDHIVELINGRFEIYDIQDGTVLESRSLDSFWVNVVGLPIPQNNICQDDNTCALTGDNCSVDPCPRNFTYDPRIIYDRQTQRWFAISIDAALGGDNDFYLGRSEGSDPTGNWEGVKFDSDTTGPQEFHDYETFSVDADAVTTCTQDFDSGNGGGGVESCYTIPKADILLPVPSVANMTRFESNPPNLPPVSGSIQPALSYEPVSDGTTPLLGVNGGFLVRGEVVGAGAAGAALLPPVGIAGDPGHAGPPAARQPAADSGAPIENVAPRFVANVVEFGDSLWAVHAVAGSSSNSAIRWYEIEESTNTLLQTGLIEDSGEDYHEPSISVNVFGDVLVGFTCSGPALNASTCISVGETDGGGVTTFETPQVITPGDGLYYVLGRGRNRWGDYSATVLDPEDDCTFWTMQEYVAVGGPGNVGPISGVEGGQYGTRLTEVIIDECAESDILITKSDDPDPVVAGTQLTYTLDVSNLGPTRAFNVIAGDLLPADVSFVSSSDGDWSCGHAGGLVDCNWGGGNPVGTLAAGQAADPIELTVAVNPSMVFEGRYSLSNSAEASSDAPDPDPVNSTATEETQVVAETDLDIERFEAIDPPDEILVAEDVPLTLEKDVSNHGPSWPVNTRVTVDATAPPDSTVSPAQDVQDVLIPTLDEPVTVTEEFVVNCGAASHHVWTFDNFVEPTDDYTSDPDLSNNSATLDVEIECVVPVIINIAPGSDPNSQQRLKGTVAVAVLATSAGEYGTPLDFDIFLVDPLSVRFGPPGIWDDDELGATESHNRGHYEDSYELDETTMDGDTDLVLHFKMAETGLQETDTEACVKGEFTDATGTHQFFGCDAIRFPLGSN
jgi:uncharacterized repeat protein (TIGR01451 family)